MSKIAVTGMSGVIGSVFALESGPEYELIDLYHSKPSSSSKIAKSLQLDLLKKKDIVRTLSEAMPDVIVHLAAITHIDQCELDRSKGKKGIVWKVNVDATTEIAKFSSKNNIPLIFLSTECVFDGEQEYFSEDSKKNPKSWYGITKSEAEDQIMSLGGKFAILRSVVAYHVEDNHKTLYGKIVKKLKENKKVFGVTDQLFTPTHSYDIVKGIITTINDDLTGILHIAPSKSLTPYDFARIIAKENKFPVGLIEPTTLAKMYSSGGADLRLRNSSLDCKKSRKKMKFIPKPPHEVI